MRVLNALGVSTVVAAMYLWSAGARPLAKNAYKVPLTRAMVTRTLEQLGRSA